MNTGIVNDALVLCLNIYHATPPNKKWAILNIARSTNSSFTFTSYKYQIIPTSYGYNYDNVPDFLRDEGVFEALVQNHWFLNVGKRASLESYDLVSVTAKVKNYLSKGEGAYYYQKWTRDDVDEGPATPGQYAVLVNMEKLTSFYNKYNPPQISNIPTYDSSNGELSFMGERIKIEGEINIKTMDLLIKNINSRVGMKELFEVRQNANYEQEIAKYKKTPTNDIVEQVIKSLKAKIEENGKLKKILIFVQKDGFGIFIDQNALQLLMTPQETPQK